MIMALNQILLLTYLLNNLIARETLRKHALSLIGWEINVFFQHKTGYMRDKVFGGDLVTPGLLLMSSHPAPAPLIRFYDFGVI